MPLEHDRMAHAVAKTLLRELQTGTATWATDRLTPTTVYWQGIMDWPRPDAAFQNVETGAACAFEFKPPSQPKREYVTGLGQALTYLRDFEFSALIVPEYSADGYSIAAFLNAIVSGAPGGSLPVGLFCYHTEPTTLTALRELPVRKGTPPGIPKGIGRKVFWAYWRDLSQYDLLELLRLMAADPPVAFPTAFDRYWTGSVVADRALKWDGTLRGHKNAELPDPQAAKLNARLSLRHLGLIDTTLHLTDAGLELATQGRIYGADSVAFMRLLANRVLDAGNHLELIFWVDEQQRTLPPSSKQDARSFQRALDIKLQEAGVIPRVPGNGGKPYFLRDEQKLWNKLGFLVSADQRAYFHVGVGYVFNWRHIIAAAT
jgi:hypothetical protein